MRLKVGVNYTPSQAVKLVFVGPRGKIKECFLEVKRLDRITEGEDTWVQLGCASIDEDKVEEIRSEDAAAADMRKKLGNKGQVYIYVVGPVTPETRTVSHRIQAEGFQTRRMDGVLKALSEAPKTAAQLAVFTQGSELSADPEMLSDVTSGPSSVARLAIVENDAERQVLLRAGLDECVLKKDLDDILGYAIERTLIAHAVREAQQQRQSTAKVLILTAESFRGSMLTHQLEHNDWGSKTVTSEEGLEGIVLSDYQLVLADFDEDDVEAFKRIRRLTEGVTLVALCGDFSSAPTAQREGADNYLCVPAGEDDVRAMLKMVGSRDEQLA
jgi:ActR/RegA family two-component response regulator